MDQEIVEVVGKFDHLGRVQRKIAVHLIIVGFQFYFANETMLIRKVSARYHLL